MEEAPALSCSFEKLLDEDVFMQASGEAAMTHPTILEEIVATTTSGPTIMEEIVATTTSGKEGSSFDGFPTFTNPTPTEEVLENASPSGSEPDTQDSQLDTEGPLAAQEDAPSSNRQI